MAAVAGAVLVPSSVRDILTAAPSWAAATRWRNPLGETAYRAAMHLHGPFSEGAASWAQHFHQAVRHGIDILVPTEHDWRVVRRNYPRAFHFSRWREPGWRLKQSRATANLTRRSGTSLTETPAPRDRTPGAGALHLRAASRTKRPAVLQYSVLTKSGKGAALGRALHLWMKPVSTSGRCAYVGLVLGLSLDPKYGRKRILYRLRTDLQVAPAPTVSRNSAVIDVPAVRGRWRKLVVDVTADIARCWPDLLAEDNSLTSIDMVSRGTRRRTAEGLFSFLDLVPDPDYDGLSALKGVLGHYRSAYPDMLVPHGMEHSWHQHLNQVGGEGFIYAYSNNSRSGDDHLTFDQVAQIRHRGGTVSYNHPLAGFGVPGSIPGWARLRTMMQSLLDTRCFGMDMLEVGYVERGLNLAKHLELFDCMSANAIFVTATGVSDDHDGGNWLRNTNRFLTLPWMSELTEEALTSALQRGRATVGLLGAFAGAMDISINGVARMGQVYTAAEDAADTLVIEGYGLPNDVVLHVWCGPVDKAGVDFQRPSVIATLSGAELASGQVVVPATGAGARYYRCTVANPAGDIIAFTNPVWRMPQSEEANVPPDRLWVAA